jgi:hypothetical protein
MAKITDPDLLNVGQELILDTSARTIALSTAGSPNNLNAKDGVTVQALYSKLIELWTSSAYNKYPFPMYTIDARSGQFQFGTDGQTFNGWVPLNDATRQMLRDGGWSEYTSGGVLDRQYVGLVALASGFPAGAQFYYQRQVGGSALEFTFDDAPNEGILVYQAGSPGFDTRTYFKAFCREYGYTYDDAVLGDVGETSTGAFKVSLPISVAADLKIQDNDATVAADAPYTAIDVEYFGSDQNRSIGGVNYPFRIIIDGAGASAEEIYTKIQYLLRQDTDIDSGAGTVNGKTANSLLRFVGDTLYTTTGVFIDNYDANDINRIVFTDQNGVERTFPFTAAGSLNFNSFLTSGGTGYYRMYFTALPGAGDDYGEAGAVTVEDATPGSPSVLIEGTISGASIPFTFAYDTNAQGGRTPATDAAVTIVAGNPGVAKPVVTTHSITRAVGQSVSLVAEQDRAYVNP